ncbi:flagellar export chaperone FliS [Ammoniphilus sp. CFH 90114]|uniref:flagellar export chaperone FliS n=1 Tax=Ammoniphilus sp. CFH 90114 TaxID=2493665 RepID=UPI00100DBF23|nr:flagellar export chaperone FliS [Ammoniphilus sp. CFH 90114]RXT04454.1 flagellar export chaperone FliS [Ammoniphilus sp. CFH 90114]
MVMNQAAYQYQQQRIQTSTPGELTLMLYNGLIKFLKLSVIELDKGNISEVNVNLIKSQNIINELLYTLKMEYDVANDMARLYDYMLRRLIEANISKDRAIIEEVTGYAEEFRDTWAQALKLVKAGTGQ